MDIGTPHQCAGFHRVRLWLPCQDGGKVSRFDFAAGDVQEMIRNRDALMASVITSHRIARILQPAPGASAGEFLVSCDIIGACAVENNRAIVMASSAHLSGH
jgi:hypothetical protein